MSNAANTQSGADVEPKQTTGKCAPQQASTTDATTASQATQRVRRNTTAPALYSGPGSSREMAMTIPDSPGKA